MSHQFLWCFAGLLGWAFLQAETTPAHSSEARCKLKLIEEFAVKVAPETYAFVYDDTAKETPAFGTRYKGAYLATTPLIFNSKGPLKKIAYDSKSGELTVPTTGNYQVTYSIFPFKVDGPRSVALAVNGKEVKASRIKISKDKLFTTKIIVKLAQGDHIQLILPGTQDAYLSLKPGISTSLLITKI
jgi:hypothetical protein